jgi:arylsulfatase A-like enzyme
MTSTIPYTTYMKTLLIGLLFSTSLLSAASVIQFGGDVAATSDASWVNQIGADQIISWNGANGAGGSFGSSGTLNGQTAGATLTSLGSDLVTLTSQLVTTDDATKTTASSGTPNILGVSGSSAAAKFDSATNEAWSFDFDQDVTLRHLVFSALGFDSESIEVSIPGVNATVIFTRTDANMNAVTFPSTSTTSFVYSFAGGGLHVPAGTDITLAATSGQWGLQAVVVEYVPHTLPPGPTPFEPNPDGGVEPTPLNSLNSVPNVIIFVADDMGIGDTSAYQDLTENPDNEQIDTPHMERLASLGTRFTDAHTNGATCSPSRISLFSGTYSFRSPIKTQAVQDTIHINGVILPGHRTTIAHILQRAGYRTYGYGKWHMALRGDSGADTNGDGVIDVAGTGVLYEGPVECGFDTYTGTPGNFSYAGSMIQDKQYMRFGSSSPNDYSLVPINDGSAESWVGQGPASPTDANLYKVQPAVFGKLQSDISTHMSTRADEPFFIYYASHSNHDPYVPANYEPDHPSGPRASLNGQVIDTAVTKAGGMIDIVTVPDINGDGIPDPDYDYYDTNGGWIWNDALRVKWWDHVTEVDDLGNVTVNGPTNRAMMVQENDIIVGYMLDFLEQTDDPRNSGHKLIDNTIFIFTSDNGADIRGEAAVGALPQSTDSVITNLAGFKGTRWEGGNRVPFIAAWPDPADPTQANGIPADTTSSAIFGLNDVYATIAEAIGHRLGEEEAVDSESLLAAWTTGQQGVVRSTDLLYKYQQRIFSRRGEMKLAAQDGDYDSNFYEDRFADNNNLDFDDMVLDSGQYAQFVRVLVDLSNDLGEETELGGTATATDMLATMNTLTGQGYSRSGAAAFENGLNFMGGDLLTDSNWHAYKSSRSGMAPSSTIPGIIAEDGTASGDINVRTFIHRAGTLAYSPGASGELVGSLYQLDGGSFNVDSDLRMSNARLVAYRGTAELGANDLALNGTNCVVIVSGGTINAANLSVGEAGTSDGFKIVRFKGGAGTLELSGADPIGFGDDGSTSNDFIDFVTGARGRLVTTKSASYFAALRDAGQLRIDGVAGTSGQFANSKFKLIALGDGRNALVLDDGQILDFDFDDDSISDLWEQEKVSATNVLSLTSDNDGDGILDIDEYVLDFDPTVAEPAFAASIAWTSGNSVDVSFGSKTTRGYLVQFCSDLSAPDWIALNYELGNDGFYSFNDDPQGAASGFYKVKVFVP